MASAQKVKGSGWERDVAKDLTKMYRENFTRTIGSGAFTGGKNSVRKEYLTENQVRHHKGDVTPPDSFFKMNMECKFYKDLLFHQLFTKCPQMNEWIDQTLDAEDEGDINIICIKINRKGKYVCIERHEKLLETTALHYHYNGRDWLIFDYDAFFELNRDIFKEICGA